MRSPLTAVAALLLMLLAGCVPQQRAALTSGHPDLIIVRRLAFSPGVVALDPSLGFSLYRGEPGAPPRERAATVGRAAAFSLADTVTRVLRGLGYDAIRSDRDVAEPGGRALIVTGAFRRINEGYRRQNASVVVAVRIERQIGGAAPYPLAAFDLDSRRTLPGPLAEAAAGRDGGANAAADRVGGAIARYVADLARLNRWPAASR
jgi:hypothetical protein